MKININRLKNYLSDLDPDTSIVDEAIATIEAVAENKTDDELYEHERPLMIAYLALRIIKAGLNVSTQNNEVHGHWIFDPKRSKAGRKHYWCSNCEINAVNVDFNINRIRYCMHCGAKMDESEENVNGQT